MFGAARKDFDLNSWPGFGLGYVFVLYLNCKDFFWDSTKCRICMMSLQNRRKNRADKIKCREDKKILAKQRKSTCSGWGHGMQINNRGTTINHRKGCGCSTSKKCFFSPGPLHFVAFAIVEANILFLQILMKQ